MSVMLSASESIVSPSCQGRVEVAEGGGVLVGGTGVSVAVGGILLGIKEGVSVRAMVGVTACVFVDDG